MVVVNKSYRIVSGLLAISWEDFRFVSFVRSLSPKIDAIYKTGKEQRW